MTIGTPRGEGVLVGLDGCDVMQPKADAVDGRNPANQLIGIGYPWLSHIIYKVLYISGGDRRISSINSSF